MNVAGILSMVQPGTSVEVVRGTAVDARSDGRSEERNDDGHIEEPQ